MKCVACSKKAVNKDPNLCKDHFIAYFENKVRETIELYMLVEKNDKIVVAASGGKDSTALLYLLSRVHRNVVCLAIDEGIKGYRSKTLADLKKFCKKYNIKLHVKAYKQEFGKPLDAILKKLDEKPCHICGVLRRYMLNKYSRKLGATKLATGHNLDDEAQTILMNLFKNNIELCARLGPKTGVIADPLFVSRIKPLYFCTEKEVKTYCFLMGFDLEFTECPNLIDSLRSTIQTELNKYESKQPGTKENIVRNFLKMLPQIRENYSFEELPLQCKKCKEPSRNEICKTCELIAKVKKK